MKAGANLRHEAISRVYPDSVTGSEVRFPPQEVQIAELIGAHEVADLSKLVQQLRVIFQPKSGVTVVQTKAKNFSCACTFKQIVLPVFIVSGAGAQWIIVEIDRNLDEPVLDLHASKPKLEAEEASHSKFKNVRL